MREERRAENGVRKERPFITDKDRAEVIFLLENKRVYLKVTPEGDLVTRVEPLNKEEQRVASEANFADVVRWAIYTGLGFEAAKSGGGDFIPRQLETEEAEDEFRKNVVNLLSRGRSDKELIKWIERQGMVFSVGDEEVSGMMSSSVRGRVEKLSEIVREIVEEKARASHAPRGR